MSLDILYLSRNRREFTAFTFAKLVENTNWDRVDRLIVYDDSSIDGTLEEITTRIGAVPVPHEVRQHSFGSPVTVMNDYISSAESYRFAKIDNDVVLPPAWLDDLLGVMDDDEHLMLLGMESPFMGPPPPGWDGTYTWTPWKHIGGVGLMRTDFFRETKPMDADGYHGFTGHQWRYGPRRGWITPDLMVCLLDRAPIEPWMSLSEEYAKRNWQRRWKPMPIDFSIYWDWFTEQEAGCDL